MYSFSEADEASSGGVYGPFKRGRLGYIDDYRIFFAADVYSLCVDRLCGLRWTNSNGVCRATPTPRVLILVLRFVRGGLPFLFLLLPSRQVVGKIGRGNYRCYTKDRHRSANYETELFRYVEFSLLARNNRYYCSMASNEGAKRANWFPLPPRAPLTGSEIPSPRAYKSNGERRGKVRAKNSNTRGMRFSYVAVISNLI